MLVRRLRCATKIFYATAELEMDHHGLEEAFWRIDRPTSIFIATETVRTGPFPFVCFQLAFGQAFTRKFAYSRNSTLVPVVISLPAIDTTWTTRILSNLSSIHCFRVHGASI